MPTPVAVLKQLWTYPVKSAAGVSLEKATVALRGLEHDRRFMVVDPTGMLVTLRERPDLAHVRTALDGERLQLTAPNMPPLTLPLEVTAGSPTVAVMWTTPVAATVVEEATAWVSTFLGGDYRLVHMPERTRRTHPDRTDTPISFVDGDPLSLVSEASLEDLNGRLGVQVDLRRFRFNLVVGGCEAYAEDAWGTLEIGGLRLERLGPCARCTVVNVDPDAGTHGREPLKTLARYRRVGQEVRFGGVYRIAGGVGTAISCGDPVTVGERGAA